MGDGGSGRAVARGERVLPGLWRLRLPLPWAATPHGNAWAVRAGDGVVLFDTGIGGADGLEQLELALRQVGLRLGDVRLVACTHTHADHYGCAASIVREVGCEVWLHPAWGHVRHLIEDPAGALEARLEQGRRHGLPEPLLAAIREARSGAPPVFDGVIAPARELVPGTEVQTDLGAWVVHEAPGHAPSHVVFHQPERKLLLSGDALVGQTFLYFDFGHTADPAGEFRRSLDTLEGLDVGLCVSGHGRPFRDVRGKVAAYRAELDRQVEGVRSRVGDEPVTAYEVIAGFAGERAGDPMVVGYLLEMTLAYLTHLAVGEEIGSEESDGVVRWKRAGR